MKHLSATAIKDMNRFYRGNLINSITGFKSASLLATRSKDGVDNVAVFSSVTHLGSNPAMFSFIQRPLGYGAGHTYENLKATGQITLNHINNKLIKKAHQTSAKYDPEQSEFEILDIEKEERNGFTVPFVKDAAIQVVASYVNDYLLEENNCRLVICKITDVFLNERHLLDDGFVNLSEAGSAIINGLDGYGTGTIHKRWSYAEVDKKLNSLPLTK